jgi:hypothetical protein
VDDSDGVGAAWAVIGVMVAFKLGLTLYVLVAYPSGPNLLANLAANWYWLLAIVVLVTPPLIFWGRLVRMRAKRAKLQRAEWHVD